MQWFCFIQASHISSPKSPLHFNTALCHLRLHGPYSRARDVLDYTAVWNLVLNSLRKSENVKEIRRNGKICPEWNVDTWEKPWRKVIIKVWAGIREDCQTQPGLRLSSGLNFKTFVSAKFCLKSVFTKGDLAETGRSQKS